MAISVLTLAPPVPTRNHALSIIWLEQGLQHAHNALLENGAHLVQKLKWIVQEDFTVMVLISLPKSALRELMVTQLILRVLPNAKLAMVAKHALRMD